jgi:hypothetical protein
MDHPVLTLALDEKLAEEHRRNGRNVEPVKSANDSGDAVRELSVALNRAIRALNAVPNFKTPDGIKSYTLIPWLEGRLKEYGTLPA